MNHVLSTLEQPSEHKPFFIFLFFLILLQKYSSYLFFSIFVLYTISNVLLLLLDFCMFEKIAPKQCIEQK